MSGKKCSKGKSCSSACISKNKVCRVKLNPQVNDLLKRMAAGYEKNVAGKNKKPSFDEWEIIGSGFHGNISVSPDGQRVVKTLNKERQGVFGPYEVELAVKMGELGHSPKVFSHSDSHIEMQMAKGAPLWKSYVKEEDEPSMNTTQARKAGYAFRDLHKMGFAHGDAHALQFLVDKDEVKMVDFGLSVPVSRNPAKVMQDLRKIEKLVQWDNPEMKSDPYFSVVNKYLEQYKALGDSQSKAAKRKREEIGTSYLQELADLP
jgi:tRNA A-37 threonylcarbamoyl transferase component Bud32